MWGEKMLKMRVKLCGVKGGAYKGCADDAIPVDGELGVVACEEREAVDVDAQVDVHHEDH